MNDNQKRTWEKYPAALPRDTILAGKYIIKNVLGQGGFGITYLAEDYKKGTKVAIKEFFPETMAMRSSSTLSVKTYTDDRLENFRFGMESFLEEAKVLAHFQGNPHIVGVQTYFEENGTAYFVMDYIEGIDFKTYIKQNGGKLPWEDVCKIMLPIMDALETVHKKGIIHRDVTPDNIFISKDGSVRLLDFGAARYSLGDRSKSLDVVLKAGYAPKEQYTRRGRQGAFTDVYSVAACFYSALSGFLPPESLDRMEEDNLVPLSARGVQLPDKAEEAILKALEVRAEDRYQSMEEFCHAMLDPNPMSEPVMSDEKSNESDKSADVTVDLDKKPLKNRRRILIGGAAAVIIIAVMAGIGISGKGKIKDGYNTYIYDDGGIYDGNFKDGKRNGQGRFTYTNGDIYIGLWNQDERQGIGTIHFANGDIYEGEWSHNIRNGQGTMNYVNGDSYKGAWSDDMRNGQGTMNYINGDAYDGEWKDDKRNGQGKFVWKSGEVYEGNWENDERSGYGKGIFTNGNTYEGEWKNDNMNGKGSIVYAQDDSNGRESYEGEWLDGKRTGQGKMIWKNGQVYEGAWKNGGITGWGKIIYAQDDSAGRESYEGEWLDDKRTGQGKMIWKSGAVYEGAWKNGNINGIGKYTDTSGNTYEGEYKENKWDGQGKFIWSTGEVYEGEWKNGKRDGHGKYTNADGETWEGEWKEGEWVKEINAER